MCRLSALYVGYARNLVAHMPIQPIKISLDPDQSGNDVVVLRLMHIESALQHHEPGEPPDKRDRNRY